MNGEHPPLTRAPTAEQPFAAVPQVLKNLPQWGCYILKPKAHPDPDRPWKMDKPPINADTGEYANVSEPNTWRSFTLVLSACQRREVNGQHVDGPTFFFRKEGRYTGIDLDECVDPETGRIASWAAEIVRLLNSYTEYSPSWRGVKIWVEARLPGSGGQIGNLEIYDHGRHFCVTGNHVQGTPLTIENRQSQVSTLYQSYFGKLSEKKLRSAPSPTTDLPRIREALPHIPADEYHTWIAVGMALHDAQWGEDSFKLWVNWSHTCTEKFTLRACEKAWAKFKSDRPKKVTIATIFYLAKEQGFVLTKNGHQNVPWPSDADAPPLRLKEKKPPLNNGTPAPLDVDLGGQASEQNEEEEKSPDRKPPPFTDDGRDDESSAQDILELVTKPYSEIIERVTSWLWYPYLPARAVVSMEGNPGEGKSWLSLALAAAVSVGRWPFLFGDGTTAQEIHARDLHEPATVLHVNIEDDPEETIKKRLRILGADCSRVLCIEGVRRYMRNGDKVLRFTVEHIAPLEHTITQEKARLVILDPIQAYLPKGADMNKAESVRPLMEGLALMARRTGCTVLILRHFGKRMTETAIYKAIGSVDFAACVRSVLIAGLYPKQKDTLSLAERGALTHAKSNLAPRGLSLDFELKLDQFAWAGTSNTTANDFTTPTPDARAQDEHGAITDAKEFLKVMLADGPADRAFLVGEGKKIGISDRTLDRASNQLKVQKTIDRNEGKFVRSIWELPSAKNGRDGV